MPSDHLQRAPSSFFPYFTLCMLQRPRFSFCHTNRIEKWGEKTKEKWITRVVWYYKKKPSRGEVTAEGKSNIKKKKKDIWWRIYITTTIIRRESFQGISWTYYIRGKQICGSCELIITTWRFLRVDTLIWFGHVAVRTSSEIVAIIIVAGQNTESGQNNVVNSFPFHLSLNAKPHTTKVDKKLGGEHGPSDGQRSSIQLIRYGLYTCT